jgi:regulator of nucleoside diphosphate kinase
MAGGITVNSKQIIITQHDLDRLQRVVNNAVAMGSGRELGALVAELDRARVVTPENVPANIVTMNSKIRLVDVETGDVLEVSLVFPEDTDSAGGTVSILAPVGTAILGYAEGDSIEWPTPSGVRTFSVEKVIFQPEAAGDWDL